MRLIDGDAKNLNPGEINGINLDTAIKVVEDFLSSDECKSPLHAYLCAVRDFAEWYRDELKNAPTIDAVPVVRGYSYEDDKTYSGPGTSNYICSVCGEMQGTWKKGLAQNQKFKFCPWCGAKMEDKP